MANRLSISLTHNEFMLLSNKADSMGESKSNMAKIIIMSYLLEKEK